MILSHICFLSLGGALQDHILLSFVITQHYYRTMFENHRKSLIYILSAQKFIKNDQK